MKTLGVVLLMIMMAGCGYSSRDNEMIGQVKKVVKRTPLICPDYTSVDISLGVLRGGVGSMSTQDVWLYVPSQGDLEKRLMDANATGQLVKIRYDIARLRWCVEEEIVRSVEEVK